MGQGYIIAIDGPAASGKSTVARHLAERLGLNYVDSGAMYRAVTWALMGEGCDTSVTTAVRHGAKTVRLEPFLKNGAVEFRINGQVPGSELRSESINKNVSLVAAVPEVRAIVVDALRSTERFGGLVMEGRDIGTKVFPKTPYKFYLDASPEERARRRHKEADASGSVDAVAASIGRRDQIDSSRKVDPLRVADGATVIDTTGLDVEGVVMAILVHLPDCGRLR